MRQDQNQVVYVNGDVPQLPLQLGQLLVDSSLVSPGNTNLQQCTSQDPLVYEGIAAFFGRTAAEIAAGVTPVNYAYAPLDVRRYGAMVDGATDDSAALQAATDVALLSISATVRIPEGQLRVVTPVNPYGNTKYDTAGAPTGGDSPLRWGGPRNAVIYQGSSRGSTTLWADNAEGVFKPQAVSIVEELEFHCRDIRFRGLTKQGRPVILNRDDCRPGRFVFDSCIFTEFEYGYAYDDYAGVEARRGFHLFRDCEIRGNKYGLSLISDNTLLDNCYIERNDEWGLRLPENANAFSMRGGKIQYNCEDGAEYTAQVVIQGDTSALLFDGVYFEPRNSGVSSNGGLFLFEVGPAASGVVDGLAMRDCYINGASGATVADYSTYLIDVPDAAFQITGVSITGGVIKNFKLDADEQMIRVGASATIRNLAVQGVALRNIYDAAEVSIAPANDWHASALTWHAGSRVLGLHAAYGRSTLYASRESMGGGSVEIVSGAWSSAGSLNGSMGGVTVNKTGTGVYEVTINATKAQLDSSYPIAVSPTPTSATLFHAVAQRTGANTFTAYSFNAAGAAADVAMSFVAVVRRR